MYCFDKSDYDAEKFNGIHYSRKLKTIMFSAFDPFSNLYKTSFFIDDNCFNCVEQAVQFYKAQYFGDMKTAETIMKISEPIAQRCLGRKIKKYDFRKWLKVSNEFMWKAVYAKFQQNPELKQLLLKTNGWYLAYADTVDYTYSTGLSKFHKNAYNKKQWKGKNLLGKQLMKLRSMY